MRRVPISAAALLVGLLAGMGAIPCQAPVQKSTPAEPAKQASLRERAKQVPLQSLVEVRRADGRTHKGRLKEVSTQGIALQSVHDLGIESLQIPFDELKSLTTGLVPEDFTKLYARKGLFLVPEGSLVELSLSKSENLKGMIEEYSDNEFVIRTRNEKRLLESRSILFSQVKYFLVKRWANPTAISDPEAFRLAEYPEGGESNSTRLQDGTPVVVRLRHTISTVDARVGDPVDFEIVREVKTAERVILPKSSAAWGKVAEVVPKRRMGRGARVSIDIAGARTVTGETLPLRATKEAGHGGRTSDMVGAMVASFVGFCVFAPPPVFLLMRGADTAVPQGTLMVAYVVGDKQVP